MGKHIFARLAASSLIALLLLSAAPLPVAAETSVNPGFNLTLSPLPINLSTKPGQSVSTPIRVQNTGNQAVQLKVSLMKFSAQGASGEPQILDPEPEDAFIKWASFSKTKFTAQPNVFNTVELTIQPPKEAAFGYYYAVVFSQDNGSAPDIPSQSKINGAVASLVLLDVQTNGEKRQLEAVSFKATQKVYQYLPASFEITTRNTGNIHVVPTGNIFISRAGSKDFIGTIRINEQQGNVLPKSNRVFTTEWDDGFPSYKVKRQNGQVVSDSSGTPIKELSWNLASANKLRIGKYTASMTMVYNDGKQDVPINGEVSFWVIPWIPFLIILIVLALVAVGLFVLFKSLLRRTKSLRKKSA